MIFIKTIFTKQQLNDRLFWIRLSLAFVMVTVLVGQLFTYESLETAMADGLSNLWPILIVTLMVLLPVYELIALPSLLSMNLSRDALRLSAYAARTVSLLFVAILFNAMIVAPGGRTGLLSVTIGVPANIFMLAATGCFAGLIWYTTAPQVERSHKK